MSQNNPIIGITLVAGITTVEQHPDDKMLKEMMIISNLMHCIVSVTTSSTKYYHHQQSTSASSVEIENLLTTTTSDITSTNNESRPWWFTDALKDIAYYLRAHKFNEYDRRYESRPAIARREYYIGFPRPPLRSLHWEVHKYCEQSFEDCVQYLKKRIKGTNLKRSDDTAIVVQEQQWSVANNSEQIKQVDDECRKLLIADDKQANPFEGPIERFQWRTTASYYMCWYTMSGITDLQHLSENCDNFAHCLTDNLGPNNRDHRANDARPYSCALYSFCPDPCCPIKHLHTPENCWNSPDNPCFEANPKGQRQCVWNRSLNTDFRDIILNRWNVTCACPLKGFEWNSLYGMCIDIDECVSGSHNCDLKLEVCINLPGEFKCVCKWGYSYNAVEKICEPISVLVLADQRKVEDNSGSNNVISDYLFLFCVGFYLIYL